MYPDNLAVCYRKKQLDVSFSCVCSVIDNEFRYNIILSSLRIHSYFDKVMTKFMIKHRTDAWKTDVNLLSSIDFEAFTMSTVQQNKISKSLFTCTYKLVAS